MFYFTPRVKDALRYGDCPCLGGEHGHCSTVKKALPNLKFLFEHLGDEAGQFIIFDCVADLDGIAADFTIFDVDLTGNGEVQDHGDLFPAVRAHESVFHREVEYDRSSLMSEQKATEYLLCGES
jgi:hypothetical protein